MVIERRRGLMLAGALFTAFAAVAVACGWLALTACGLELPGLGLIDACRAPPAVPAAVSADEAERRREMVLTEELSQIERRLSLAPSCPRPPAPPPAPPAPPVPTPASVPAPPAPAPKPPPKPQQPRAEAKPACEVRRSDNVVLLLDVSGSMEVSYDVPAELERRLNQLDQQFQAAGVLERIALGGELAAIERKINAVPGRKRIDLAKDALTELVDTADPSVSFDFATFSTCGPPRRHGRFPADQRPTLKQSIREVELTDHTALAATIQALPSIVPRRSESPDQPINVVLVSDGFDSCGGDPCAAAAALERLRPDININVVAVSRGIDELRCIARNTGGRFFKPSDTSQITNLLKAAAGQASANSCE